ncbi:hypothetical protein FISHEDRAFT_34470 [Fistulina hepatica ATCC 64428]|uniref:Peptidase S54 rhomboid domain-containing protein n=1 Tax=Fistulina hepatica ATCC 64428 TaxID=1128425 RepID=A0A0D7AQD4_9AGAR|nr:hypothetical protein FISHEDRAFT_34470 [Fistulina hepatica ATCC 64428]
MFLGIFQPYADASDGRRLCWKICMVNACVWVLWQIPALQRFMMSSFTHHPLSGKCVTMLTCVFSHKSFWHLLLNCMALDGFGSTASYFLSKSYEEEAQKSHLRPRYPEAAIDYHFLAFFISAGLFSSLVGHIVDVKLMYPRAIARAMSEAVKQASANRVLPETWSAAVRAHPSPAPSVKPKTITPTILPGLGASGAIYSCMVVCALAFPDATVAFFIPPGLTLNIRTGVSLVVLLDVIGVIRGWRFFAHWVHLGGALFGYLTYHYDPKIWRDVYTYVFTLEERSRTRR